MYADNLSSPLLRRRSGGAVRQGHGGEISRRRPHPDSGDEAAAGLAIRRDRSRQDQGSGRRRGFRRRGDHQGCDHALRCGANADVQKAIPALAHLASVIGDPAVRYRGTIGGSIANNDPAADYPAAVLALGATVKTNKRSIPADDFFKGLFATALADGEIITAVSFPIPAKAGYSKIPHPASRFALTGVFIGQDQGRRCPRRRHRRLAERRDAGTRHRGGAEGELVAGSARQRQDFRRRADDAISMARRTIAPT